MGKAPTPTMLPRVHKLLPLAVGKKLLAEVMTASPATKQYTPFQLDVFAACACVPAGSVATYGEIAAHVDSPQSARAVGQALSVNPFAPRIPCHRVVGSTRHLTGFCGTTDTTKKKKLLVAEGVTFDGQERVFAMHVIK